MSRMELFAYFLAFGVALSAGAFNMDSSYRRARTEGARLQMEISFVDDDGNVVPHAEVAVFLGMNVRANGHWTRGLSDTNGVFLVDGTTCGDEVEILASKAGHYDSSEKFSLVSIGAECGVKDGRWQIGSKRRRVALRRIGRPADMRVGGEFVYTDVLNSWLGYDLERRDFIAPHGKGVVADFDVCIDWDGEWLPKYSGMGIRLRFPAPFAGFYSIGKCQASTFKGPYAVCLENAFEKEEAFYEKVEGGLRKDRKVFDKGRCWVVRSRCKVDSSGKLAEAHYSVIHHVGFAGKKDGRGGFCVIGALNPTPNDTNLEPRR